LIELRSRAGIENALYGALAQSRGTSPAVLRAQLGSNGEIDSLEGVELVAFAEALFGVHLADHELTSRVCRSIPQLAAVVGAKMASVTLSEGVMAS